MISKTEVELQGNFAKCEPQIFGTPSSDGLRMRSRADDDVSEYDESLGVRQESLNQLERCWGLVTVVACAVDLLASTTIMVVAFKYAYRGNGVSLYCISLQAFSHELSSALLLARLVQELLFYRSAQASELLLLRDHRRKSLLREQLFSVLMGIGMLISSVALLFKAFRKLRFWDQWYLDHANMDHEVESVTDWLAWWGFAIYSVQAAIRFVLGRQLRQALVWHCFISSSVSLVYLLVMGIGASQREEWAWKAEPIAAIALAFVTLAEGVRIIIYYFDDMDTRLQYEARA